MRRNPAASKNAIILPPPVKYIFAGSCSIYSTAVAVYIQPPMQYIFVFREYIWGEQIHIILLSGKPAMAGHLSKLGNCFEAVLNFSKKFFSCPDVSVNKK